MELEKDRSGLYGKILLTFKYIIKNDILPMHKLRVGSVVGVSKLLIIFFSDLKSQPISTTSICTGVVTKTTNFTITIAFEEVDIDIFNSKIKSSQ